MSVYVPGTFDLFHVGHLRLLRASYDLGLVVVGLNTDEFVERYKSRRPVMPLDERMELLRACRYVDRVIVNTSGEDSRPAILEARADVIVHGDDWTGPEYLEQLGVTQKWLDERAIRIVHPPYTPGVSTSELIARVNEELEGRLAMADRHIAMIEKFNAEGITVS